MNKNLTNIILPSLLLLAAALLLNLGETVGTMRAHQADNLMSINWIFVQMERVR